MSTRIQTLELSRVLMFFYLSSQVGSMDRDASGHGSGYCNGTGTSLIVYRKETLLISSTSCQLVRLRSAKCTHLSIYPPRHQTIILLLDTVCTYMSRINCAQIKLCANCQYVSHHFSCSLPSLPDSGVHDGHGQEMHTQFLVVPVTYCIHLLILAQIKGILSVLQLAVPPVSFTACMHARYTLLSETLFEYDWRVFYFATRHIGHRFIIKKRES
jgi:hypothetical protein